MGTWGVPISIPGVMATEAIDPEEPEVLAESMDTLPLALGV